MEKGLRVVGLHSPEFDTEKDPARVRKHVRDLGITYPVVLDNNLKMWEALGNHYWPAFYLVDRQGRLRHVQVGETHSGAAAALQFERVLMELLASR
jgi:hypothetical protein